MAEKKQRRWSTPKRRSAKYVDDLRAKVHTKGPKEGKELTEPEKWLRRGYLQCQTDNASTYKYKKAFNEAIAAGKNEKQAKVIAAEAAVNPMKKSS